MGTARRTLESEESSYLQHPKCPGTSVTSVPAAEFRSNNSTQCRKARGSGSRSSCSPRTTGSVLMVMWVAFAITLLVRHCDATPTGSASPAGSSDISGHGSSTQSHQGGSSGPSLHSNLVAVNFSSVGSADQPPLPYLELQDPVEGVATAKERAMYVQQLESNFAKLKRRLPIYQNEFAVHIPSGPEAADRIAHKYGFENMGQVSRRRTHTEGDASQEGSQAVNLIFVI